MVRIRERIICKDDTGLSVQASEFHYCIPRDNNGPYTHVEVGFPTIKPPRSWKEYCENWKSPTETVYGQVPIEMVKRFIKRHGGIDSGEFPPH